MKEFQQSKLYAAERQHWSLVKQAGKPLDLFDYNVTAKESAEWCGKVHQILVKAGFPSRPARRIDHSPRKRGGGWAEYGTQIITVSRVTSRSILIHEQCHLTNTDYPSPPGHGVEFAAALVAVYDAFGIGDEMRTAMRESKVYWTHAQRQKEVTAKAKWLLRENGPGRLKVLTRRDSDNEQQLLIGRATRDRYGITFDPSGASFHGRNRVPTGGAASPTFIPYEQLAYVEAY